MHPDRPVLTLVDASTSPPLAWASLAEASGAGLRVVSEIRLAPTGAIVVLDLRDVEDRLPALLAHRPPQVAGVVVLGGSPDHRLAIAAMRQGADEYFALPGDLPLLAEWLAGQVVRVQAGRTPAQFAEREAAKYRFDGILGESAALRRVMGLVRRVIPHPNLTVLIGGENGTGKELLARAIHYNGPRQGAPFVDINCAAIPEQLLESELFGHEKGAFTGAVSSKPGLFEVAHGGTIFLDEVATLSLSLQGKLLRVLEQRTVRRVGGTALVPVDVRVIAATHVPLADAARSGAFRTDLYYRLNVVNLTLPALRERGDDILLLARAFLARFAREYDVPVPRLAPTAERVLLSHAWPGNVRELRNTLERAILMAGGGLLDAADLGVTPRPLPSTRGEVPFPASMAEITRAATLAMVRLCNGNKSEAARRLGISRTRLLRLLASRRRPAAALKETP
ncbi:MAG: sigma-54-dependent Fis family transcriptional regulator [Gemmatimonadetes bacterium]|nr:sigma-54-dependent Fis family transcriptional regulator [Gemmatimonadota bacterium]